MKVKYFLSNLFTFPFIIILAVCLPFAVIGIVQALNTRADVISHLTASGMVISNQYIDHVDPENSTSVTWTYHPVVRFTSAAGDVVVFIDNFGSYPAKYGVGEMLEVLYDPENPQNAAINTWLSLWGGSAVFIIIGTLPILVMIIVNIFQNLSANRKIRAAREAYNR